MSEQEYYYNGKYMTIFANVEDKNHLVLLQDADGYGDIVVAQKSGLVKKEDSYHYKRALEEKEKLEAITAKAKTDLNAVADKVVDKALIALASRMKFNVLFGKDMANTGSWAFMVMQELEKLVKEKAPEVIKEEESPFE